MKDNLKILGNEVTLAIVSTGSKNLGRCFDQYKGQRVNVEPMPNDAFSFPFAGRVIGFRFGSNRQDSLLRVEDMDGDVWDCFPEQCEIIYKQD